jgi:hypothetical protein
MSSKRGKVITIHVTVGLEVNSTTPIVGAVAVDMEPFRNKEPKVSPIDIAIRLKIAHRWLQRHSFK